MNSPYEPLEFNDPSYPYILRKSCYEDFPPHWHDSIEIHSLYRGTNKIVLDSKQYSVGESDIVCINSCQIHWYANPTRVRYYTLIIHPRFLKKCGISPTDTLTPHFKDPYVTQLFEEIIKEDNERPPYYESSKKSKIMALLIYLYRNHKSEEVLDSEIGTRTEIVVKILTYIKEHYAEDITLSEIGKAVGLSVNYMCACFRQETQMTIKKYINNLRCIEAKNLLSEGRVSVTEAGMRYGFNNMSYFSKMYYKMIGELPSETLEHATNKPTTSK